MCKITWLQNLLPLDQRNSQFLKKFQPVNVIHTPWCLQLLHLHAHIYNLKFLSCSYFETVFEWCSLSFMSLAIKIFHCKTGVETLLYCSEKKQAARLNISMAVKLLRQCRLEFNLLSIKLTKVKDFK